MTANATTVGHFRSAPAGGRWWWSDEMYVIHGMEPGEVVPTRDLFLSHAHPEDRPAVDAALDACGEGASARSCEYRLLDLAGAEHRVMLAAAGESAPTVTGFVVDATSTYDALVAEQVNAQLSRALESHAAIDQAKGVLMLTYGVDSDEAFGMLRSTSQQRNVRLRTLAERVVNAVDRGLDPQAREHVDARLASAFVQEAANDVVAEKTPLSVRMEVLSGVPTLRVCGRVDLSNRDDLAAAISALVMRSRGGGTVEIDLRDVDRLSSAAADVLAAAIRRSAAEGVTLRIIGGCRDAYPPRRTARSGGRSAAVRARN